MQGTGARACPLGQASLGPRGEEGSPRILFDHLGANALFFLSEFQSLDSGLARTSAYGTEATAWFESALSLLLESTAVTT